MPDSLLRRQLLGELARQGQIPEAELQSLWLGEPSPPPASPSEPQSSGKPAWKPKSEWKPKGEWQGKGDWKSRRDREEQRATGPRAAPGTHADTATRLLLLHSDLWDTLGDDDRALLHELPGVHGELIQWLERYLVNHGAAAWAVIEAALQADGLADAAARLSRPSQELGVEEQNPGGDLEIAVRQLHLLRQQERSLPKGSSVTDEDRRLALELMAQLRARHGLPPGQPQ